MLRVAGARSHKNLICWQRAYEFKLQVYELIRTGTITADVKLREQLRESAAAAPRLIAEGFGRYYPAEFSKYLRHYPNEYETMIRLANLYYRQKRIDEAQKIYQDALHLWRRLDGTHVAAGKNPENPENLANRVEPSELIEQDLLHPLNPMNPLNPRFTQQAPAHTPKRRTRTASIKSPSPPSETRCA